MLFLLCNWETGLERLNILPKVTKILSLDDRIQIQDSRALALKHYGIKKTVFPNVDHSWTTNVKSGPSWEILKRCAGLTSAPHSAHHTEGPPKPVPWNVFHVSHNWILHSHQQLPERQCLGVVRRSRSWGRGANGPNIFKGPLLLHLT